MNESISDYHIGLGASIRFCKVLWMNDKSLHHFQSDVAQCHVPLLSGEVCFQVLHS